MLKSVFLEKNVLPFLINVPFSEFQKQYILAKTKKDPKYIEFVYKQLSPTFLKWNNLFATNEFYSDITIYTLLRLLQADDRTPGTIENKLDLLNKYLLFFNLSFFDICTEAFLLHINKKSYIPMYRYSKPKDLFYYIAKEIKMFIFSIIRKMINYQNKQQQIDFSSFSQPECYYDVYFDTNVVSSLSKLEYSNYVYLLLTGKFPSKTDLNYNETFIKENLICQLTKTLLYSN